MFHQLPEQMTNVPNLHSLCPGWASLGVHWCCLPLKFHRYWVSTLHKGDTAAWGHHYMVQNTKTTPVNPHFCRNQALQAQHQLPLRVPRREEKLGATRILAMTTMWAQDRTGKEGRMGWGWDERAIMVTGVFCLKGHLNCKTDRLSLYQMS